VQAAAEQLDACRPLVSRLAVMTESLVPQINGLSIDWLRGQAAKPEFKSTLPFANSDAAMPAARFDNVLTALSLCGSRTPDHNSRNEHYYAADNDLKDRR
jgi:hypothetical protein